MKTQKNIYFLCLVIIVSTACNKHESNKLPIEEINSNLKNSEESPVLEFNVDSYDFGTIIQGEKVAFTFKYKNVGCSDLVITSANTSCGCTVPKWNKNPLSPGKEGKIEVVFDSAGRRGSQNKTVTIKSNAKPGTKILRITAEIVVPN